MQNDVTPTRRSKASLSVALSGLFLAGLVAVAGASSPIEPGRYAEAASPVPGDALEIVSGGAHAVSQAERIIPTPVGLRFPMDPLPRCIVGNNFGAMSKLYGSGAHEGVDIAAADKLHHASEGDGEHKDVDRQQVERK
jgi:hypothetical protein